MAKILIAFVVGMMVLSSQTQQISPSDYVWYNFDKNVPIQEYSEKFSLVDLPCETRIGSCSVVFTTLPPNWKSQGNSLLIPTSDITTVLSYAIEMIASDPTGESVTINAILEFRGGVVKSEKSNPSSSRSGRN